MCNDDVLASWCDVLFEYVSVVCEGLDDDAVVRSVEECVNVLFSLSLLGSKKHRSGGDSSLLVKFQCSESRLIVKKRPPVVFQEAHKQVFLFFNVLESFLGVFVEGRCVFPGVSEAKRSSWTSQCSKLIDTHGVHRVLEATFGVIRIMGPRIWKIIEQSMLQEEGVHRSVVVDTFETYLCRSILVGALVVSSTAIPEPEKKHISLLPWWLFLGGCSGLFSTPMECQWSKKMTKGVLFFITDSLVRQSFSSRPQCRELLLEISQEMLSGPRMFSSYSPELHPKSGGMEHRAANYEPSSYREGQSINIGAEALVCAFLRDFRSSQEMHLRSPMPERSDAPLTVEEKSPSPAYQGTEIHQLISRNSLSSSPIAAETSNPSVANPRKMRKLALQFAVKLGNLYATQDVHAMLSYLPGKANTVASSGHQGCGGADQGSSDTAFTEEENFLSATCSTQHSLNDTSCRGKEKLSETSLKLTRSSNILQQCVFEFLRCLPPFYLYFPLSSLYCKHLSLFLSLFLLSRIFWVEAHPPTSDKPVRRLRQAQEVLFGFSVGRKNQFWPQVLSDFLDNCGLEGICAIAIGECHQTYLAKQLMLTVTSFTHHCSDIFASDPRFKKEKDFMTRRWISRWNNLVKELRSRNSEECTGVSCTVRFRLLQHFYLLVFYLFSTLKENTRWLNSARPTLSSEKKNLSIPEDDAQEQDFKKSEQQKKMVGDFLLQGEGVLHALHSCMNQLPWMNALGNSQEKVTKHETARAPSPTDGIQRAYSSGYEGQPKGEGGASKWTVKFQSDEVFLKYCIHYYLTVVDLFIEMAIYTSSAPSYLTAVLLRSDEHNRYAGSPISGASIHSQHPLSEAKAWQGFLNYHCLSIMKNGTRLVNMDFISALKEPAESFSSHSMERYFFDSLQLDHLDDFTPLPEKEFNHSWYFLRILNHAKHVTQYLCSPPIDNAKSTSHSATELGYLIKNSFRIDVSRFVDGVTPFLSTSSGIFAQNLSVPHQHPFSSLEQLCGKGEDDKLLKISLEEISCDLWLRTQALQLISIASSPINVLVHKDPRLPEERIFILNGSAARTYVRLLFLRIIQAVFSQQGRYDEDRESFLLRTVSKGSKDLYQLSKRLWVSCLILSLRAIQFLSHNHAKARETAINLGVHGVLSRLIDALSANQQKDRKLSNATLPSIRCHSSEVQLDDAALLGESISSVEYVLPEEAEEEKKEDATGSNTQGISVFSFSIPPLNLDGVAPPMYFVSSGDTGAALQATLFPGMNPATATVQMLPIGNESSISSVAQTPVVKGPPSLSVPLLDLSGSKLHDSSCRSKVAPGEEAVGPYQGLINPSHLYADPYLLSCAVCCTCSLLVHHSGMLRYESTVSTVLLRKRMHLPEASYHLLYGGDSTWKKHVEDTKNSATLKKFLGWCYSDQRPIRPSSAFRSLRECISNSVDTSFLNLLESWLDENTLTHYRNSLNLGEKSKGAETTPSNAKINSGCDEVLPFSSRITDDGSMHSIGVFVLLRLLLPRAHWSSQFEFRHRLGAGGFGTVMAADFLGTSSEEGSIFKGLPTHSESQQGWLREEKRLLADNPAVALKTMPFLQQHDDDSGMLPMCHAEVLAMMCLRGHPYVVPLLSFGSSKDGYFIVLPRYEEGTLHDWRLKQYPSGCAALVHAASQSSAGHEAKTTGGAYPKTSLLSIACSLFTQLLEAVVFMHSQHLRHNDIKADNLLIDQVDRISCGVENGQNSNGKPGLAVLVPRAIRLSDFGSCDTCTDADIQELLRDLVAGESRFMEGRWGFGNGTEAIQPPEIIVPRWRYELMRTVTLHFVASQCIGETDFRKSLTLCAALAGKSKSEEGRDIATLFDMLRRIELSADIWSCGCLLYEVLTGVMLFGEGKLGLLTALATSAREQLAEIAKEGHRNVLELFQHATKTSSALNHWDTDDLVDAVGQEVVDFLQQLLSVDPLQRPTALEALEKWKDLANRLS